MLYIIGGPDDFSVSRELERLKQTAGDPAMLATNTSVFEGGQINLNDLKVACETVPFLAEKRLVIVYGLLENFAVRTGAGRTPAGKKPETQTATYEQYAGVLNHTPDTTLLVLIENEIKDNNPLLKLVKSSAVVKEFPALKGLELQQWINQRVVDAGGSISPNAVRLLSRLVGSNLWAMSGEIQKLTLYADGRRIEEADVNKLVAYVQQVSVFNMVDAIVEFNLPRAGALVQQLLGEGESPLGLLSMLNRQMRLIVRARELKSQKIPEAEIKSRLGIGNDFVFRKVIEQSQRYTLPRLRQVYEKLLETDIALKTSRYEGDLALDILVTELCQDGNIPAPGARSAPRTRN